MAHADNTKINVREIKRNARVEAKLNKRAGDMSDLEHILWPLWNHRQTLIPFVMGMVLVAVTWLVVSARA